MSGFRSRVKFPYLGETVFFILDRPPTTRIERRNDHGLNVTDVGVTHLTYCLIFFSFSQRSLFLVARCSKLFDCIARLIGDPYALVFSIGCTRYDKLTLGTDLFISAYGKWQSCDRLISRNLEKVPHRIEHFDLILRESSRNRQFVLHPTLASTSDPILNSLVA